MRLAALLAMAFAVHPALSGILWAQNQLPEGEAKEAVQAMCVQCHQIGRVTGMHLSRGDWKNAVEDMVRMGAEVPPEWVDPIVDYLALNFPEKPASAAADTHGVDVSMEIVRLPPQATDRTLPASVKNAQSTAVSADGFTWYLNGRGFIGRLDSVTGAVQEWPWPGGIQSPPKGIAVLGGDVWTTQCAPGACSLMRFVPETAGFQTWPMPRDITAITQLVATAKDQLTATAKDSDQVVVVTVKQKGP